MFMCLHATQSILRDAQEELRVQWSSYSQPNIDKAPWLHLQSGHSALEPNKWNTDKLLNNLEKKYPHI